MHLDLEAIPTESPFAIYSEATGRMISEHANESEALKAFTRYIREKPEPESFEAAIYRRGINGWEMF